MPRKPHIRSGGSLTIHAKTPAEEEKIRAYKEIHARNEELEIQTSVMAAIDKFLREHNWPPGNSQTVLAVYREVPSELRICQYCNEFREKTSWCKLKMVAMHKTASCERYHR